ncbi:MobA/MobL family protein [Rosenbergiella collisarenosi]|uniref:MobA/MobL family protein n=1 Tax=Rosenbergiella collisarenosi TaxID=1544695 RepID=UPI001F4E0E1D|nr:MobA/MobL family protein [Rosenbergiella collisarenosi]
MAIARLSMKAGMKGRGADHAAYIAREGRFANRLEQGEKLEATESGNMPAWATGNPQDFWLAADAYERKNGTAYREMEIALPRELSPEQRRQLVRDWVSQELGTAHTYQWAVHVPRAADGGEQPHAHIMFSERRCDSVARDPEQYFKRYNSKAPENGGAKKGYGAFAGQTRTAVERRQELVDLRERWAVMCNSHLEKAEQPARIDMRSYADQGVDSVPERKMLPSEWRDSEIRQGMLVQRADKQLAGEVREETQVLLTRHVYHKEYNGLFKAGRSPSETGFYFAKQYREQYLRTQMGKSARLTESKATADAALSASNHAEEAVQRIREMGIAAQSTVKDWREDHKIKAWMHDKGLNEDPELLHLESTVHRLYNEYQALKDDAAEKKESYRKAKESAKTARCEEHKAITERFDNYFYHSVLVGSAQIQQEINQQAVQEAERKRRLAAQPEQTIDMSLFEDKNTLNFGGPDIDSSAEQKKSEQHTPPRPKSRGMGM